MKIVTENGTEITVTASVVRRAPGEVERAVILMAPKPNNVLSSSDAAVVAEALRQASIAAARKD